jgi:hypothetical protein
VPFPPEAVGKATFLASSDRRIFLTIQPRAAPMGSATAASRAISDVNIAISCALRAPSVFMTA